MRWIEKPAPSMATPADSEQLVSHRSAWILTRLLVIAAGLVASSCSDDSSNGHNPARDAAVIDAAGNGDRDAGALDAGPADAGQGDADRMDAEPADAASQDAAPVASCTDIDSQECFSNLDCPDLATRCENVGSETDPVACCVTGPRGTGQAGQPCLSENDCASAVCIEHNGQQVCSTSCNGPEDCPEGMKNCILVAFSGSDDKWCFPQ